MNSAEDQKRETIECGAPRFGQGALRRRPVIQVGEVAAGTRARGDQQSTRKDNGSRKTAAVAVDRRERGAAQGGGEGEKQWGMFCSAASARPSVPLLLPRPTVVRRDAPVRQSVIKSGEGAGWVWAVISLLPLSAPTATTARAAPATIATQKK